MMGTAKNLRQGNSTDFPNFKKSYYRNLLPAEKKLGAGVALRDHGWVGKLYGAAWKVFKTGTSKMARGSLRMSEVCSGRVSHREEAGDVFVR